MSFPIPLSSLRLCPARRASARKRSRFRRFKCDFQIGRILGYIRGSVGVYQIPDTGPDASIQIRQVLLKCARYILASGDASYITGQTIYACGGLTLYPDFRRAWSSGE